MTCLIIGASFDPDTCYNYAMPHVLPFGMPFDGGDNNDGITIIDITDLRKVKHSFAFLTDVPEFNPEDADEEDEEGEGDIDDEIPSFTPLSGLQYEAAYERPRNRSPRNIFDAREDDDLIDEETLNSAWPDRRWGADDR